MTCNQDAPGNAPPKGEDRCWISTDRTYCYTHRFTFPKDTPC